MPFATNDHTSRSCGPPVAGLSNAVRECPRHRFDAAGVLFGVRSPNDAGNIAVVNSKLPIDMARQV